MSENEHAAIHRERDNLCSAAFLYAVGSGDPAATSALTRAAHRYAAAVNDAFPGVKVAPIDISPKPSA